MAYRRPSDPSVRLSVCPSHAATVSKPCKLGLRNL